MRVSARNVSQGDHRRGHQGRHDVARALEVAGAVITASITNEAVDELGLTAGNEADAVVKASDVLVVVD